jgi:TetR/AcrR family transcriptional regulator, transcriptional repressor for nem operon
MSVRAERKQETHHRIAASAARLLRTGGIDAASVAEVMKGAGLTVGGFYAHYPSKDALIEEVLRQTMHQIRFSLLRGIEDLTPRERLARAIERYLSRTHRDHPEAGCPLPAVASGIAHGGTGREALAQELEEHAHALGGTSLRPSALGLLALMVGGLTLARAVRGGPLSDEILKACRDLGRAVLSSAGGRPARSMAR